MKPARKKQSGQSLVEMAISLMIILLLLLGAVEVSLALFQYVTIRDAAQEGAFYGSFTPADDNGIRARAVAAAADVVTIDPNTNVNIAFNGDDCEGTTFGAPNSITVTITFRHDIIFPLINSANPINLTASVTNTILSPTCP